MPEAAGALKKASLLYGAKNGLRDKNEDVRFAFAMALATGGDQEAIPVLKDMLKHSDHHRRETAAEHREEPTAAGREQRPKKDKESWNNLLKIVDEERIRVCGHVERLNLTKARSALEELAASPNAHVASAAKQALSVLGAE